MQAESPLTKHHTRFPLAVKPAVTADAVEGRPVSEIKLRMRKWRKVGTIDIVTVRIPPKTSAQVLAHTQLVVRATRLNSEASETVRSVLLAMHLLALKADTDRQQLLILKHLMWHYLGLFLHLEAEIMQASMKVTAPGAHGS